jgi:membrane protein implicated in regulation of membrane protease activity
VLAEWIVRIFTIYVIIGALFAIVFVSFGVGRVDASARGAGVWFRALIFPGVAALWPLLAWRWLRGAPQPRERNAHRRAAQGGRR